MVEEAKSLLITPIDSEAQNSGSWFNYHGVDLKIGRTTNPAFRKSLLSLQGKNESSLNSQLDVKEEASVKLLAKAISVGLLFDWKNHPSGEPYSKENAELLMIQDEDCRGFVLEIGAEISNFYKDKVNKTLGKP